MRILMSMFGWQDSGGGTIFPRQLALELARRGHEVMVIYSAVAPLPQAPLYSLRQHSEQGVQLIGIHNRPALFTDELNPRREIQDPEVVKIFSHFFAQFQPDLVHYHNFLGLSLGIAELAYRAGVPSFYTPYQFWLLCPTLYLNLPNLEVCRGVNASGSNCLGCTHSALPGTEYVARRDLLREHYVKYVGTCLATSESVRELMLENGYPEERIQILQLGNDRAQKIWREVGQQRQPGHHPVLRIGFIGSLIPIKGVHTLVAAAQELQGEFELLLYGEASGSYAAQLRELDQRGVVKFMGRFADEEQAAILASLDLGVVPSICLDHSPLVIGEFQAARVPVVGARIGGIPDYIQAGTGALFEAGNTAELAQVLQALINNPAPILDWQRQLEPPIAFEHYVNQLEGLYLQADKAFSQQALTPKSERFLRQRGAALFYAAHSLRPLTAAEAASQAYGLDLLSSDQLELSPSQFKAASWIICAQTALQTQLEQAGLSSNYLAPWQELGVSDAEALDLGTDKSCRVLLLLQPEQNDWRQLVLAWLDSLRSEQDVCLILLAWSESLELCQQALESLLDNYQGDLEHSAEMILFEQSQGLWQTLAQALAQVNLAVLPPALLQKPELAWCLLNAPAVLLSSDTAELEACLKPAADLPVADALSELSEWFRLLPEWKLLAPDTSKLRQLWQANQQTLVNLLQAQIL